MGGRLLGPNVLLSGVSRLFEGIPMAKKSAKKKRKRKGTSSTGPKKKKKRKRK